MIETLVGSIAPQIHADQKVDAARIVLERTGQPAQVVDTESHAEEILGRVLQWCFDNRRLDLAAQLLWAPSLFTPLPRSVSMIWNGVSNHPFVGLMGASSMGKSYTPGVLLFLEWLADPQYTNVKVIGPSENHLQDNLFTHLVKLHEEAALPVPGIVMSLFIGLSARNRRSAITGVVMPLGKKAAGRLQGAKRHPRKEAHPRYGKLSRLFILIDELENVPPGLYADLNNLVSNYDEGDQGFKVVAAWNPKDVTLEPARLAEPVQGWERFDLDRDEEWTSKRGWRIVRLDAEKSENVVQDRVIFPGLQTASALKKLAETSGGRSSPGYYTFGRGAYPKQGVDISIIPAAMFDPTRAELVFVETPKNVGGCDLALDGGDLARFAHGRFGVASGLRLRDEHSNVLRLPFRDANNNLITRRALQVDAIYTLPKGETLAMAKSVSEMARALGVSPDDLALDQTGHTRGVVDVLRGTWGRGIIGVNSSEGATDMPIVYGAAKASETYDRVCSELVFAVRFWVEFGALWLHPDGNFEEAIAQFAARKYDPHRKNKVESKKDYKLRNQGRSPDEMDAIALLVHAVRHGSIRHILPAPGGNADSMSISMSGRALPHSSVEDFTRPAYIDPTNIIDDLD